VILDEVDVLTPDQQAKLLRVIETGEYELVGSNDTQVSRAAAIVSSNRNLEELVAEGKFRKDLFYRLNTLSFVLPPLRKRPLDIEYLLQKFALDHSRAYRAKIWRIEPEFRETMQRYEWPGNIREMDNVMRRACLYCRDGVLTPFELPGHVRASVPDAGPQASCGAKSALLERRVRETESQIITETLRRNNYRRTSTAEELGISRVTLYNKMRRLGILDSARAASNAPAEAEDKT
jgi:DNA-binding NtrC family response regulator